MNLYLAAPWKDRAMMPDLATIFEAAGHTITHKWWDFEEGPEGDYTPDYLEKAAIKDYQGVIDADKLILFNTAKSEGKAVEQGIALASGLDIIAIGTRGDGVSKNVFHYLPEYTWVTTIEEALCLLT